MVEKEELLHYVWKYKLYRHETLKTTEGLQVEVIDGGLINTDAGPDFFNAKIKIGDTLWAGDVEIHLKSDEWNKHHHHLDKAYNSVILHVVEYMNSEVFNENGQSVPQMILSVQEKVITRAGLLLKNPEKISCQDQLSNVPRNIISSWLDVLSIERLERKTQDIYNNLQRFNNSWNDVFYVLLTRSYGFGLNSEAFERLALSLPYNIIQKHRNSLFQIEALLFGQAGMLQNDALQDEYYLRLRNEYLFLQKKYLLKPLESYLFKSLRVRPQSFPQIRLAQLAAVLQQSISLFSSILEIEDIKQLRHFFQLNASDYWQSHYVFGKTSVQRSKFPGSHSLNVILINTVAPVLFAYGRKLDLQKYCDRSFSMLESLKPECNSIVENFYNCGIIANNALETQALIQLKREYCDKRKCLYCKIGYFLLSSKR